MAIYVGDAATAGLVEDPKGCYVGRGNIWVETTSTTAVFKAEALDSVALLVKVPAAEFRNLVAHGVTHFTLRDGRLEASREGFRAALPYVFAAEYSTDIKVIDHEPLDPPLAGALVDLVGRAMAFTQPDAVNPAYRFIYATERKVFATDGHNLFIGRLPGYLVRRMVFTNAAGRDLLRLWKRAQPVHAMHSPRSLLLKNGEIASSTRCVDTPVPTDFYRLVRTASLSEDWASLPLAALRNAVKCLQLAAEGEDAWVRLKLDAEHCTLEGRMGVSVLGTVAWQGHPRMHLELSLGQLVQAVDRLDTGRVLLGRLPDLRCNLALASADAGVVIAVSAKEERRDHGPYPNDGQ